MTRAHPAGTIRLRLARTQQDLLDRVGVARTTRERAVGLLNRSELAADEGLLILRCQSIHTIGMRVTIDAVFVNRAWQIVALHPDLGPGRLLRPIWPAAAVVEAAGGWIAKTGLHLGDQLQPEPTVAL